MMAYFTRKITEQMKNSSLSSSSTLVLTSDSIPDSQMPQANLVSHCGVLQSHET